MQPPHKHAVSQMMVAAGWTSTYKKTFALLVLHVPVVGSGTEFTYLKQVRSNQQQKGNVSNHGRGQYRQKQTCRQQGRRWTMYQSRGRIFDAGDHIGPVVDLDQADSPDIQDRAEVIKHFKLLWREKWGRAFEEGCQSHLTPNTHATLPLSQTSTASSAVARVAQRSTLSLHPCNCVTQMKLGPAEVKPWCQ